MKAIRDMPELCAVFVALSIVHFAIYKADSIWFWLNALCLVFYGTNLTWGIQLRHFKREKK